MTEPVPGQTPEPAAAEAPQAHQAGQESTGPTQSTGQRTDERGGEPGAGADVPPTDPQELFGSLSLTAIEADIDRLMNDKMSELDGMLAGLEELVQKLEGEITQLEPPTDDTITP